MTTLSAPAQSTTEPAGPADPGPRRRRPRLKVRLVIFAVLAVVIAGVFAWLLSWQSPVPVRTVTVTGAAPDKQAEVKAAAAIVEGTPIRDLAVDQIVSRVGSVPGIEGVEVVLQRPWTIDLAVEQRVPFAVTGSAGQWTVVDRRGQPITQSAARPAALPQVTTAGAAGPAGALAALAALPPELRAKVRTAAVDAPGTITLTLNSGVVVAWGLPGQEAAKAKAVVAVSSYKPTRIDVSVPQRPALSGPLKLPQRNQQQEEPVQ